MARIGGTNKMPDDDKKMDVVTTAKTKTLWQSQRGMILVIAMLLLAFLAMIDATKSFEINLVVLTAYTAGVGAGFVYFFKAKTDEAKMAR